jgi:hypothetical protein
MQNAETVLDVLRERGRRGLPCNELYRQLFLSRTHRYAEQRAVMAGRTRGSHLVCGITAWGFHRLSR